MHWTELVFSEMMVSHYDSQQLVDLQLFAQTFEIITFIKLDLFEEFGIFGENIRLLSFFLIWLTTSSSSTRTSRLQLRLNQVKQVFITN